MSARPEFLELALGCGAVLTGKPDGSEAITVVFTIEAWRAFDAAQPVQQPAAVVGQEPVAYAVYGISAIGKHYLHSVHHLHDEWEIMDQCLGERWAGNVALVERTAPVPAAGVRGDAEFARQCAEYKARAESAEKKLEYKALNVRLAALGDGEPDSGRYAALEEAASALDILCYGAENGAGGTVAERLRQAQRTIRALAAHPAPSSDAALTKEEIEDIITSVRSVMNPAGSMFIPRGWNVLLDKLYALAAHPANGAQVGADKIDAERYRWLRNQNCIEQMGSFTPYVVQGQTMRMLEGAEVDAAVDAAILAAAKKGTLP